MGYCGGKRRGAEFILERLNAPEFDGMDYLEPFVGYAHILRRVVNKSSYGASDANPLVAELMRGIQRGMSFPEVSKEEYHAMMRDDGAVSFRRAVACFAYSYNGHAWRGYIGGKRYGAKQRCYVSEHRRYYELLAQSASFQASEISCRDYATLRPEGKLIYCDPPYAACSARSGYVTGSFDSAAFWQTVREWSKKNVVFVSEYAAPADFVCVASSRKRVLMNQKDRTNYKTERLFVHESLTPPSPTPRTP